jgi:uncharacterized membrane protein YeaQ/YmgE (transglycosylase-associated protein family)
MNDDLLAWMSIGAAASFVAMMMPFQRGVLGVITSIVSGVSGALAGGLLAWFFLPGTLHERRVGSLLFAAVGAVVVSSLVRVLYLRRAGTRHHRERHVGG